MKKQMSFEQLAALSRAEQHRQIDVADAVLNRLETQRQIQRLSCRPLAWIATLSSAAAACVGVAALWWLRAGAAEGMTEVFDAISWVTQ